MLSWRLERVSERKKIVWHLMPFAICWELWNERNRRFHGGRAKSKDELVYAVKLWICLWSSTTEIFNDHVGLCLLSCGKVFDIYLLLFKRSDLEEKKLNNFF